MYIFVLSYLFLTFLVGNISCGCPAESIACGTACCDTSGPLISYFCADASKNLCCVEYEHESNGICCGPNLNNCGGTCCGGECLPLKKRALKFWPPFRNFDICIYTTDAQCQSIGAMGLCTPSGSCPSSWNRCDGQCCFEVPR